MDYIVFDLEWNQSPDGKKYSNSRLPFEIIEIGAVKLNEDLEITDSFHRLIRPQVYNWIHESIHEVIHVDYKDLEKGIPFPAAAQEFLDWCGRESIFFTWGNQDLTELQRNLKFYDQLYLLRGPVRYYDVQKLYALFFDPEHLRRALEHAISGLDIPRTADFHRALADACYTARVLKKMNPEEFLPYFSVDVYQNPRTKREEIRLSCPDYDKFISREFADRDRVMKDREVSSTRCPVCHLPAKRKIRWFMNNSRIYYSVSFCRQHGYVEGKVRIRRTEEDRYFAVKTLRIIGAEEAEEIRSRQDSLRKKRRMKKSLKKEI